MRNSEHQSSRDNGIAILDNDVISLISIQNLICKSLPDIPVIWSVTDGYNAIDRCLTSNQRPSILLVDMSLDEISGLRVCKMIRSKSDDIILLAMTSYPIENFAARAANSGCQGIISKAKIPFEIKNAITTLFNNQVYYSNDNCKFESTIISHQRIIKLPQHNLGLLSNREMQVMNLCLSGNTLTQIAQKLNVSDVTIRTHVSHIKKKLDAKNLCQAAIRWAELRED